MFIVCMMGIGFCILRKEGIQADVSAFTEKYFLQICHSGKATIFAVAWADDRRVAKALSLLQAYVMTGDGA